MHFFHECYVIQMTLEFRYITDLMKYSFNIIIPYWHTLSMIAANASWQGGLFNLRRLSVRKFWIIIHCHVFIRQAKYWKYQNHPNILRTECVFLSPLLKFLHIKHLWQHRMIISYNKENELGHIWMWKPINL